MRLHGDKVLLLRLYEKTSASGNRYFAGRMGAAKVAMFLDTRADGADPCWQLFVQSGDDGQRPPPAKERTAPRRGKRRELPESVKQAIGWAIPDDPLPGS